MMESSVTHIAEKPSDPASITVLHTPRRSAMLPFRSEPGNHCVRRVDRHPHLADASHARNVRKQEGGPVTTDGPFAEAKEVFASYAIYDLEGQ